MNTDLITNPMARPEAPTTGQLALQSREVAETQVKYLMAQRFPRDEVTALDGIINAFSRPGLAERAAYEYAKGGSEISGPSIHAAQAIAQQWGNIEFGFRELSRIKGPDGVGVSEVEAYATDLQSRVPSAITFVVRHWRDTKRGGYALTEERDVYELTANMAQRRKRACILSVLPQDVIDTAMAQAALTLKTKADTSPEAMAKMVEAFAPYGVSKDHIEKLIQRRLESITPAQVVRLKRIYASLRDGVSVPEEWFDIEKPDSPSSSAEAVAAALKAEKAPKPPAPPPAGFTFERFASDLQACPDSEVAALILDEARSSNLTDEEQQQLSLIYRDKFSKGA